MRITTLLSASILAMSSAVVLLIGAPALAINPTVVTDTATYTDQPRVATLPATGGVDAIPMIVAGVIAAGMIYIIPLVAKHAVRS